ncbi:MAG: endonuclease domain-containing protein [Bacteroidaceae bacterium]|nr:endonuclease domain-containing protein [Bacteroidaceae bacterium]
MSKDDKEERKIFGFETASEDIYPTLKEYARRNRHEMTPSETLLWQHLRKEISGFKFRRQHAIGDYIADFICVKRMLVIEVDGGYHNEPMQQQNDQMRTDYLESKGYTVIRFKNEEISNDLHTFIMKIKEILFNE